MDGEDHEHTVIRPRRDIAPTGSMLDPDPGGLVDDTLPRRSSTDFAGEPPADDRQHSMHAQVTAPSVPRGTPQYRFRVNGGEPFPTDASTFIGRSPRPPRIPGKATPRLVRVDSASHEVSGTHLELRQEGSSVIIVDLRSTNGTIVTIPGAAPVRMLPGESMVAVPGSLVDIGDGNVVEILGIQRQVPVDVGERLSL